MRHQPLFDLIYKEAGFDVSRNKGVKAYLAHLDNPTGIRYGVIIRTLYVTFQPHANNFTAMAAAISCANKYLNGGQIAGFGTYMQIRSGIRLRGSYDKQNRRIPGTGSGNRADSLPVFLTPEEQLLRLTSDPAQARKTFQAIKPETLEKYRQIIHITNRFRTRKEQPPHGKPNQSLDSQPILHQLPVR